MSRDKKNDEREQIVEDGEDPSFIEVLASGAWKFAAEGPRMAIDLAQKGLTEAERRALSTLRRRMDAVADEEMLETMPARRRANQDAAPATAAIDSSAAGGAPELMAQLLEQAQEQTREDARHFLALHIARQLVPDEARIIAALSDGREAALLHLAAGPRIGKAAQRWMENLSSVGREAGIQLLDQTSHYIEHLRALQLLESGAEDPALLIKYQLLEADSEVRSACAEIEKLGMKPRFFRRTIRLSEFGRTFWATCNPAPADDP